MAAQDVISALTVLFIVGMIWLRTRMQYSTRGGGRLRLERAGQLYFAAALGLLVVGWLAAPAVARLLWPAAIVPSSVPRVVWFLATYYIFIVVHRVLKSNGVTVFRVV